MRVGLILHGNLKTVSGGFFYDRMLVDYLRRQEDQVEIISLPWLVYARALLGNVSPRVWRRIQEVSVDVYLQDELAHPSLFWLNRRLRRLKRAPLVAIVHHLRCAENWPPWQKVCYRWIERRYLRSVDAYIANSLSTREMVERFAGRGKPAVVARPGGNHFAGSITPQQIEARARTQPFTILFLGNLIPRKGLHILIAALACLPLENWRLHAVGSLQLDPPYVERIRRQLDALRLHSRVFLLGHLSRDQVAAHLARSHLLAVPSSFEGYGIAYLEGMSFGLPAIASTAGGAGEIITDGQNGFLVEPDDAATLANRLAGLMEDRNELIAMSLAAKERSAAQPTWEETGELIRRFLHGLGQSMRKG
jgi:glycosyltransferase involved in cell wall biosynthesis